MRVEFIIKINYIIILFLVKLSTRKYYIFFIIIPRRVNLPNLITYYKKLLNNSRDVNFIIYFYKNYIKSSKNYLINKLSKENIKYIRLKREYYLVILLLIIRRIHNKYLIIRNKIYKV